MTSPSFLTFPKFLAIGLAGLLASCGGDDDDAASQPVNAQLTLRFAQAGPEHAEPQVHLSGVLPQSAAKEELVTAIKNSFAYPIQLTDGLERRVAVDPAPWLAPLTACVGDLLGRVSSLKLEFSGRSLAVDCVSGSEEDNTAVRELTVKQFASSVVHVSHDKFRVESVQARPAQVTISMTPRGELTLRGFLPNQELKDQITTAAKQASWHRSVSIDDSIIVRPYAEKPDWVEDLVAFLSIFLDSPQSRQIYVSSDSVRVTGQARSDREKRSVVYAAGRAFLDSNIPVSDSVAIQALTAEQRQQVLARQSLEDYVKRIHIYFGSGHYYVEKTERRKLQAIAAKLSITETEEKLRIVGLTDGKGDPEINESIKRERCKSVHKLLLELGCDPDRLILGLDYTGEGVPGESPEKLRRCEFQVVKPPFTAEG